jgi:hypothetical protein
VSGAGAEIWSAECAKSRLYEHLQFKFFPGIILQTPLNGEGGERRRRARSEREGKIEG